MSSFADAFSQNFGQAFYHGASAASDARRERLQRELQAEQNKQREEEKKLAAELRAKQERDQTLGLFFKAMGSDNPDEIGAAAQHFGRLAAQDPIKWGDHANELTTRAADAKKKRATEELLKAEQIKAAAEQNQLKTDLLRQEMATMKERADPANREIGQALGIFESNRNAPGVAASVLTPPEVPMAWDERKGRLLDALNEQQGRIDSSGFAAPGGAPGAKQEPEAKAAGGKVKHTRSIKRDAEGNPLVEDTYTGEVDRIPDTAGAAATTQTATFTPDTRDVKEHKSVLADIEELHYEAAKNGDDPKDVQEEAGQLLAKLKAIHKRRIAMTPPGPEQLAVAEAAAREFAQAAGRFGAAPRGSETPSTKPQTPKKDQAPSPKGEEPIKPELLAGADKLQPVGSQGEGSGDAWDSKPVLGSKGKAAAVVKEMFTPSDSLKEALGMKASPGLEAELKRRQDEKASLAQQREAVRKLLIQKGVPNPSDALIDEWLKSQKK